RQETPQMQEVKFLYQNIKLQPDQAGVKVTNENLFEGTDAYMLKYSLLLEGQQVYENVMEINVAAQSEEYISFTLPNVSAEAGEYVIHTSLVLKESTLWAD